VILAAQAGVAVENAHLNEELEARVQRLDALHAISTAIVQGDDADAVTGLVARQARAAAGRSGQRGGADQGP
jgi:GAF domain-containing protein